MVLVQDGQAQEVDDSGGRIGIYHHTRPRVLEFPCNEGLSAVIVTDGVSGAGSRRNGVTYNLAESVESSFAAGGPPQHIADRILARAVEADGGRPGDDMTVLVLQLGPGVDTQPVRRITYSIPIRG